MTLSLDDIVKQHIDEMAKSVSLKVWLTSDEAAEYIRHSKSFLVSCRDFIEGIHYFKPSTIRLYNREKLDEWIRTPKKDGKHIPEERQDLDQFLSSWQTNTEINGFGRHTKEQKTG